MKNKNKWYVTTPIYYATARPHLGSLYSTLLADVIARWKKLEGKDVFFLTGTDEFGQKIALAAQKAGKDPKTFINSFISDYQDTWHKFDIAYDYFMRTTDDYHIKAVQSWVELLLKKGDIYKGHYAGWYCTPCETFISEDEALQEPPCTSCGRLTHWLSEESYFFRLSAYQQQLLSFYRDNPDFIVPRERTHEVVKFVEQGLKDLSISRTTVSWGIPFPGDPRHVLYVWADALNNYITAIGYGQPAREEEFRRWWPADVQVMGKDIIRFHAIYWPAFLMAADLALPRQLLVHGWIKINQQKMSKSLGNVIDPLHLLQAYGPDAVRYYLVRYMAVTHDGEFSIQHLEQAITSDLANDLGNLLNRILGLAQRHQVSTVSASMIWDSAAVRVRDASMSMLAEVRAYMNDYQFHMALAAVWKFINTVNAYIHEQQPWKSAQTNRSEFEATISAVCHSLHIIALALWPVMPSKMEQLLQVIGVSRERLADQLQEVLLGNWQRTFILSQSKPLFEKQVQETNMQNDEMVKDVEAVDFSDFLKIHLVIGTIVACVEIPGSDKLLQLQVSCGAYGERQILSGIKAFFSPDQLIGKQALFVLNLKPRKMMGLESQGMLLTARDANDRLRIVEVEVPVPNGTRLQ